jgi:hypothetical protein
MRSIAAGILLASLCAPALGQSPATTGNLPRAEAVSEHIRVQSFELRRREDNYGIANFELVNDTDKTLNSIELFCWLNGDRARGTRVLVWPSPHPVPAHQQQRFSNVNIGLVGLNPRGECEVAAVE